MNRVTKTLGKLFLKLELRGKDGSRKKLLLLLTSYFLPGFLLPLLIFEQNADASGFEFTFLTFLFYSLILAITAVMEMDNLIISKSEIDTLSCLPLENKLIVNAKLYVLLRYGLIISFPLLLPGAFFYFIIVKSATHAILYLISGFFMFIFILSLLLLIYSLILRRLDIRRINNYTLLFQIILMLVIIIGYQYISYSLSNRSHTDILTVFNVLESKNLLRFFPNSWFAFIAAKGNYVLNYKLIFKIILPFLITYMSWLSLKFYLTDNYSRIYEKFVLSRALKAEMPETKRRSDSGFNFLVSRFYLNNNPQEQSSFTLMRHMLGRDKTVRLNILPMIIIPVGIGLFALITNQLPSPFLKFYPALSGPAFHISIMATIFIVINTSILGVKITYEPGATWIYDAYPLAPKKNFINGIRKFFFIYLILPVCLILFVIFSIKMSLSDAAIHTLFLLVSATLFSTIFHIFNKTLPYTKSNTVLNSLQRIGSLIFPLMYGILFAVIQYLVYRNLLYTILFIIFLMGINYILVKYF